MSSKEEDLKSVQMLGLKLPTDPRWVNIAEKSIEDILTDHAYCEQKAATTCISLIVKNPDRELLVKQVAPVVTEEWGHFRMVLRELEKRGLKLGTQRKDEYVIALQQVWKKGGSRTQQLIENLLNSALIEARSCERFRLLSLYCADENLRTFYYDFMVSEAAHYTMFFKLALEYGEETYVRARWAEVLEAEAKIIENLEHRSDRIH